MIVRLMPEQVSNFWNLIKTGILDIGASFVPGDWNWANNIMQQCLAGLMQVWLCSEERANGSPEFKGFVITAISTHPVSQVRSLDIFMIYFYKPMGDELLKEGAELFERFAKTSNCSVISFSTYRKSMDVLVDKVWAGKYIKYNSYSVDVRKL